VFFVSYVVQLQGNVCFVVIIYIGIFCCQERKTNEKLTSTTDRYQ